MQIFIVCLYMQLLRDLTYLYLTMTWPYGRKTFECDICTRTCTPKIIQSEQNIC